MEITLEVQSPWDSQDAAIFAGFINTVTGRRLFPKLLESAPILLSGGPTNEILIRAGEFRGFSDAARSLLALQSVAPVQIPDATNYPAPENDGAWSDGQNIQPK